ncbi:MAG: Glutamate-1-semialdehyde 2,1-aminomutase [Anaerolineae bacterium]|nr:Glutamate-1-semialdehyde 2,1-aminomutase [Anaerolineae bacterium]
MNRYHEILARYVARTPKSQALNERARRVLPGGDTRTGVYYAPYPAFMAQGSGKYLTDVDGNQYLDLLNNFTSLVHGHAHPALVHAAQEQLPRGTAFASPMLPQLELAETLAARVPSIEMVRFCNSGTEATMLALRAARAYTRRSGMIKMIGGYHGSHDFAAATMDPEADRGLAEGMYRDIYFASFNDLQAVENILREHAAAIAGILVEPIPNAGGLVLPRENYLRGLRALADQYNALLIFDEVITLRLNAGGFQNLAGVTPDLTALGKIIGGGFPVGAFGGKREIMQTFDPRAKNRIVHSGTFNGNNATMAAGLASLRLLDQPAIDQINALGQALARGFDDAFQEAGIMGQTTAYGSLVQVHWQRGEILNMQDVARGHKQAGDLPYLLHLELANRGVWSAVRGEFNTSTVLTQADVNHVVTTFNETLHYLKPYVAATNPTLLMQ